MLVAPLTSRPERFLDLQRVYLFGDGSPYEVETVWNHSGRWVFKLRGVDSIDDAERFRGAEVRVPIEERAPLEEGEYFHSDLVGCEVVERSGRSLGRVASFVEGGGCGLLELERSADSVRAVDLRRNRPGRARRIVVDLPEGLKDTEPAVIFHVLTIFPEFFQGPFDHGVVARARDAGVFWRFGSIICGTGPRTGTRRWTTGRSAAAKACC